MSQTPKQFKATLLADVELARGYFEEVRSVENKLVVKGWMLLADRHFSSVRVYMDGNPMGLAEPVDRPDVGKVFPWILHADHSGFRFEVDKKGAQGMIKVDVVGFDGSQPVGRMSTLFRADLDSLVPTPPSHLMQRVEHTEDPVFFKCGGLTSYGEFLEAISRHCCLSDIERVLDWGCGCGRITAHFLSMPSKPEIFGCDIDAEAVAWCQKNLQPGSFQHIEPWPPTPYEDRFFDLVIGCSVFTHLARDVQTAWLAEMCRIIAPGGLFLASTHGEFAASFAFHKEAPYLLRQGIFDETSDVSLERIAPDGYYRATFQTRDYTVREWSRYFEIIDYIERGMRNLQDLVVMRRVQ